MNKDDKDISEWLRREYGIQRTWLEHGGKHNRLCFDYQGKVHQSLSQQANSSNWRSMPNRKADLKRMLGQTMTQAEKQSRTLEEMMTDLKKTTTDATAALEAAGLTFYPEPPPAPKPSPGKTWDLRVGSYQGKYGPSVLFSFPGSVTAKFPDGFAIEKLDGEHWKFTKGRGQRFLAYHGTRVKATFYDPGYPTFGSSPGEAVEVGDEILVSCPMLTREKLKKPYPWAPTPLEVLRTMHPAPSAAPVEPQAAPATPVAAPAVEPLTAPPGLIPTGLEDRMRACAREVREIELLCPYHLTRLADGRIQWRAPVIE